MSTFVKHCYHLLKPICDLLNRKLQCSSSQCKTAKVLKAQNCLFLSYFSVNFMTDIDMNQGLHIMPAKHISCIIA